MTADAMRVRVEQVRDIAPTSTIMLGDGTTDEEVDITFAGDRRMMQNLAAEITAAGKPLAAHVEPWQIWSYNEP